MAASSNMLPLGTVAPAFELYDTISGAKVSLEKVKSSVATVIMFICNHCPYVIHINSGIVSLTKEYTPKGISFVAISSNDIVNYPEDSPENMKAVGLELGYIFPYLYDETQSVAKAYDAACTPDLYVFDKEMKLVYRGQFDDSRPGNGKPVTGKDLRKALDNLLVGKPVDDEQIPSIGCSIKWKN
ncbi:MAG: thioredoxin family protein [FCB group bacterium]|jgi:peroxiredoxin